MCEQFEKCHCDMEAKCPVSVSDTSRADDNVSSVDTVNYVIELIINHLTSINIFTDSLIY